MGNLLKVKELENEINISRATINRLVQEGLPYEVIGARTKVFDPDKVREFLANRRSGIDNSLNLGDIITNEQLSKVFKCGTQGGMRRSHGTNSLVLISHHIPSAKVDYDRNPYEDIWTEDGILLYTGMGLEGNQDINFNQNYTLANSNSNGVVVYLFECFKEGEYTFRGIVKLVGNPFQEEQKDKNGMRLVWKFPLKPISNNNTIDKKVIDDNQNEKEKVVKKLSDEELEKKAKESQSAKTSVRTTTSQTYERNPYVAEYAKRRANGICQLCAEPAPFKNKLGEPYLEIHHIEWLSKGGSDTIENTVALCPNCHKKMHVVDSQEDIEKLKNI